MENSENMNNLTSAEPDYEWGVKFRSAYGGLVEEWGYDTDPRNTVIDSDGEIEVDGDYREVIAVGKRVKSPTTWENLHPMSE